MHIVRILRRMYTVQKAVRNTSDFTKYTSINDIRAGDIIQMSGHWIVVLERNGSTLRTAEGNFSDKVRITTNGWSIKNGKFYNIAAKSYNSMVCGYHYNFAAMNMTFSFNANGGSGTMSSYTIAYNGNFTIPECAYTRTGYSTSGYNARRSDGKWYVAGQGWFTDAEIASNGYTKRVYAPGGVYTINNSWTQGLASCSFTLYPVWTAKKYTVRAYENYSGKNYFIDSGFLGTLDTTYWASRNTSIATISVDKSVKHDSKYNT